MMDFERLGLFYLGRPVDPASGATRPDPYLVDARDFTTHAMCVGMTGSGKTGLCLSLLEEAAIDGIPVLAIDPKGDVGNLLLSFPSLDPSSFEPWVSADDAARAGVPVSTFAQQEATRWKEGLASWGQDAARIARMRAAAEFTVYTPGSSAGRPLSILQSLAAPPPAIADDAEMLADRVAGAVGSLLSLLGVDGDPLTSREHILLSTLLTRAWSAGESVDLGTLIQQIQTPPVTRVGVMDLEAFFPQKDRFALATRLNNLLASPGFAAWLEGDPLDIGRLLYDASGRPRVSVISIAHLDDAERMFVVSLLLGELVTWMRTQPGTTSLRAMLYMDEVFGYLPPIANPPSKRPMLTLLKQARAFGLGVTLATQNPVDMDYKALANIGIWMIGRLQTDRDRGRLLDGLEGAAGGTLDRAAAETAITGLGKRRFFVHNVHAKAPVTIESRWCLSYLRGPLTREDLKRLKGAPSAAQPAPTAAVSPASAPVAAATSSARPVLPPDVPQFFSSTVSEPSMWVPTLYGAAEVAFVDAKRGVDVQRMVTLAVPLDPSLILIEWDRAVESECDPRHLEREPAGNQATTAWGELPAAAAQAKSYPKWSKDFERWLAKSQRLELWRDPQTGLVSAPDEDERAFRVRVNEAGREQRDAAVDKIRTKYASKIQTATDKVRRMELALGKEQQDVSQHRVQAGLSTASTIGAAVLGALFGRSRGINAGTIGKATTAAKGWARGSKEAEDVTRAEDNLRAAREALAALEAEVTAAVEAIDAPSSHTSFETVALAPKRGGVHVHVLGVLWEGR